MKVCKCARHSYAFQFSVLKQSMEQTLFNVTKTLNLVILTNAFCIKMFLEAMSIRLKKFHRMQETREIEEK